MDFATSEVHIFSYDPNVWESGEHFLTEHFSEQIILYGKEKKFMGNPNR